MNRLQALVAASVLAMVVVLDCLVGTGGPAQAALVGYWPMEDGPGSGQASNALSGGLPATLQNMDVNTAWVTGQSGNWALQLDSTMPWVRRIQRTWEAGRTSRARSTTWPFGTTR